MPPQPTPAATLEVMSHALPTTERGRATRARIVRAAVDVIGELGPSGASIDQVLARSGASKGQLYHYFEDRDALIHAAVDATIEDVMAVQHEIMDRLDTWPRIQSWFDCLVELQTSLDAKGGCPMAMLAAHLVESDEHARLQIFEGFERWERVLAQGLAALRERGELRPDAAPEYLATATMASIQGGLVLTQVRRDPGQLRIVLDAAWSHLQSFAPAPR